MTAVVIGLPKRMNSNFCRSVIPVIGVEPVAWLVCGNLATLGCTPIVKW